MLCLSYRKVDRKIENIKNIWFSYLLFLWGNRKQCCYFSFFFLINSVWLNELTFLLHDVLELVISSECNILAGYLILFSVSLWWLQYNSESEIKEFLLLTLDVLGIQDLKWPSDVLRSEIFQWNILISDG